MFDAITTNWLEPDAIWQFRRRLKAEDEVRNLTPAEQAVGAALAALAAEGVDCPTERQIVLRARRSPRSVARAKKRLAELGLLAWQRRGALVGGAWRRTSCRYRLQVPDRPAVPVLRCCNCQKGRTRKEVRKQAAWERVVNPRDGALATMLAEAAGMPDLLALRRRAWEAGLVK
jgi:hypothetical protein